MVSLASDPFSFTKRHCVFLGERKGRALYLVACWEERVYNG
jgi:hypothetical protein